MQKDLEITKLEHMKSRLQIPSADTVLLKECNFLAILRKYNILLISMCSSEKWSLETTKRS
jgi:hypothetical protein